jgi:hypothetical protein
MPHPCFPGIHLGRRFLPAVALALAVEVLLSGPVVFHADAAADGVRDIGDRRELLVDDWLIDSMRGVSLRLHQPVPREIALPLNQPWAGPTVGFTAVMKDGDRYRLYYTNDSDGASPDYTSYAESKDGISWTMPKLGLIEFNGSKDNNLVWAGKGIHNFNPFRDDNPAALPDQRYKALGGGPPQLFASPDGIRWKKLQQKPVLTDGAHDSQNLAFWDSLRGEYVAYARHFMGVRHIRTATSRDFINWSPSRPIDFGKAPAEHLYTNAVTPYFRAPHLYVGLPMRFVPNRKLEPGHPYPGVSDGVFISSRDGLHFDRRFLEAFIQPDVGIRNWTDRTNLPTWGVVPTGPDEMSVYWVEHFRHPSIRLRRGVLRLDGFASAYAPPAGGELVTRPIRFKGSSLRINFRTSAPGTIRVALEEPGGAEVQGYGLADCHDIYGNEIERIVTWKNGPDLGRLAGRPVRLRFTLKDADLYSIRFAP